MDYYLRNSNAIKRLTEEWKKKGKIIIAYDFDETVYDFHKKGRTYKNVIELLKRCQKFGAYFIVFTCCGDSEYDKITNYLNQNNLPYDQINENVDFIEYTGRKVYYNIFLDDRAGLSASYKTLLKTIKIMEKGEKYEN